jgi:hypothetical protein
MDENGVRTFVVDAAGNLSVCPSAVAAQHAVTEYAYVTELPLSLRLTVSLCLHRLSSGTTPSWARWMHSTKASSWQRLSATNSCCKRRRH